MALDEQLIQQLLLVFESELAEHIQLMTSHILALETQLTSEINHQHLEDLLLSAHTLKGAAKGMGILDFVTVIHLFESIVSALEKGKLQLSTALLDVLLESLDALQDIFNAYQDKKPPHTDVQALQQRLEAHLENTTLKQAVNNPPALFIKQTQYFKTEHKTAEEHNKPTPKTKVIDPSPTTEQSSTDNTHALAKKIQSSYSISTKETEKLSAVSEDLQNAKLQLKQFMDDVYRIGTQLDCISNDLNRVFSQTVSTPEKSVVHELIKKLSLVATDCIMLPGKNRSFSSQFHQSVQTLTVAVNSLRLIDFGSLLAPLQRTVRDLSKQQNKHINFIINGSDIKIDRLIYKQLNAPLIHLINNAIDHGIESQEDRIAQGKNSTASLTLSITKQDNQLIIYLKDDGRGIDPELIKRTSITKKLITAQEAAKLNNEQALMLIFMPGFSSTDIITTTSGRGMGLDVVRSNIHKIKGRVKVNSTIGKGTEFILKLPFLISSEQGLLISSNQQLFALPAYSIEWVKTFNIKKLQEIDGKNTVLDKQNKLVSLFSLAEILGNTAQELGDNDTFPVLYISNGQLNIAIIVDEIIDEQELIIKNFSYPLIKVPYTIGMTLLASGELIPVLNVEELITQAMNLSTSHTIKSNKKQQQQRVLIVDDSITTRTLESNILKSQGYHVTTLNDGYEAWQELSKNQNYDLILTDVEMPRLNGFQLVEKIKNNKKTQMIPTIIITSLNSDEDKKQGVKVGANAYITKDMLNTDTLKMIIQQLI